jgi:hypothetical protein
MPKNDDLGFKSPLGAEQRDHEACQELQTIDHPTSDYPIRGREALWMKFSAGTATLRPRGSIRSGGTGSDLLRGTKSTRPILFW